MMGTEQGRAALHWALEGTRYHSDSAWLAELVRIMQVMYECNSSQSETLAEAVPEAMKNVLLVMATRGVLSPAWTVSGRDSIMLHALEYGQHEPWFHDFHVLLSTCLRKARAPHAHACVPRSWCVQQVPQPAQVQLLRGTLRGDGYCMQDPEGRSLWDLTWYKAHAISANLTPSLLAESGLVSGLPTAPKSAAELESAAGQQPGLHTTSQEDRAQPLSAPGEEPSLVAQPEGTASATPSSEPGGPPRMHCLVGPMECFSK